MEENFTKLEADLREQGPPSSPTFVINTSIPPQGASNHEGATTSCQAKLPTLASPKLDEVQEEFSKQLEETQKDFEKNSKQWEKSKGLLIHCFQDSLAGSASRWYNQLTRDHINSWKDLAMISLINTYMYLIWSRIGLCYKA
ncbi:hypothetical protein GQ457_09G018990 [Hibiscus cannabinus]